MQQYFLFPVLKRGNELGSNLARNDKLIQMFSWSCRQDILTASTPSFSGFAARAVKALLESPLPECMQNSMQL
jgi:hypothetical protein